MDARNRRGRQHKADTVVIATRKLSIPTTMWALIGSPVHMIKDRHIPTGELHLVGSTAEEPTARKVDIFKHVGKRVRLSLTQREKQALKKGEYLAEVAEVLGRPVIIIKGAFNG